MLKYEITHKYEKINVPEKVIREVIDRASWVIEPTFLTNGRTAWYKLPEPIEIEFNGIKHKLKAVKMKGVGVYNPEGRHASEKSEKPIPPTNKIYKRDEPHFGFDKNNQIIKIHSDHAPYGGICHDRAVREYDNARILFENNVPTIIPFMVISYNDLFFDDKQMGAVFCFSTEDMPHRLLFLGWDNDYLDVEILEYYDAIKKGLNINGDIRNVNVKLEISKIIAQQFGDSVRRLSEAGLYIHSGGWENIQYDRERKHIFLTDLDSSRQLNQVKNEMKAIIALRDFVSNIYRYINKIYFPKAIKIYNPEILLEHNVLYYLLKGYLPEISDSELEEMSQKIWLFFMPYFMIMKKNEDKLSDIPKEIRKSFKFDTDIFYILCLNLIYPKFLKINSNTINKDTLKPEELEKISKNYLGSSYKYIKMYL
ncbi:MAG: hypothetical protein K0R54_620 [Clostridiaceae bacterium]|jgi:hypothetical protein|nr:hypothetical protein [Clostridiaceae bacterium]